MAHEGIERDDAREVWRHAGEPPLEVEQRDDEVPGLPTYGPERGTAREAPEEPGRERSKQTANDQGLFEE